MEERYNRKNRRKYDLRVHIVLATKYRKPLFASEIGDDVKQYLRSICIVNNWELYSVNLDLDHIHILLGYDTTERISDIVKKLKQSSTRFLWERYSDVLLKLYWKKKVVWSDGYFACSTGELSTDLIQRYIENQG